MATHPQPPKSRILDFYRVASTALGDTAPRRVIRKYVPAGVEASIHAIPKDKRAQCLADLISLLVVSGVTPPEGCSPSMRSMYDAIAHRRAREAAATDHPKFFIEVLPPGERIEAMFVTQPNEPVRKVGKSPAFAMPYGDQARCQPKTDNDHLEALVSRMATVTKIATKAVRWGFDSAEPREGHENQGRSNRDLMLTNLDNLRAQIDVVERILVKDHFTLNLALASRLHNKIDELTVSQGVQTTLSVLREIAGTTDPRELLSQPEKAQGVIDRIIALLGHHEPGYQDTDDEGDI